jgi:hypothetical protein
MTVPAALRHQTRGAAMAETAMVISFTLVMLFSIMQLILLGYFQIAGDAATFIAAHEYTLGVPQSSIASLEQGMVPAVVANAVTFIPSPPPSVDASLFTKIYGTMSSTGRNGGYTLVRPQNFQVALKNANYNGAYGFKSIPLSAGAVEGYYLMTNNQMDNAGVGPNDDLGDGSVLTVSNSSPFLPQSDAVIANMNTPPYYLPSPTMMICTTPWLVHGGQSTTGQCSSTPEPWFLGLGEYLSNYNYGDTSVGTGSNQTFQAMAIHQRIYQKLIPAFPAIPTTPTSEDANLRIIQTQFANYSNSNAGAYAGNGCTTSGSGGNCGSNWVNASVLPNDNGTGTGVALAYYDPLRWWLWQSAYTRPSWSPGQMWSYEPSPGSLPGNDGPAGPSQWGGSSPALVYYWDQPNYPPRPTAPGGYPTHPLNGGGASGDPGY